MSHILIASRHDFPPYSTGGGEFCALELAMQWAAMTGKQPRILSSVDGATSSETYIHKGCRVYRSNHTSFKDELDKALEEPGLEMVISYLSGTPEIIAACEERGIPVGLFIVDRVGVFDGMSSFTRPPAVVVAISNYLAHLLHESFHVESIIFPPLVNEPSESIIPSERRFGLRRVGMINPNRLKGGEMLKQLAEALPDEKFAATRGWEYEGIAPSVTIDLTNIEIIDWSHDMDPFYDSISILIVPSLCPEGYGRVAREAILRGIAVIASNRGALSESSCGRAIFLDPTNLSSWHKTLSNLLKNYDTYKQTVRGLPDEACKANRNDKRRAVNATSRIIDSHRAH